MTSKLIKLLICVALIASTNTVSIVSAQRTNSMKRSPVTAQTFVEDVHSYSNPQEARVKHVDLDWDVLFDRKIISGTATLTVERNPPINTRLGKLILDTRDLTIEKVETSSSGANYRETEFSLGATDKIFGAPLNITLPSGTKFVRIHYSTSPNASGLQWLTPEQTAGKKLPFMFSQAQAIRARSFIPLQDSPQVRITYSARVRTPKNLLAVMSAQGNSQNSVRNGDYRFRLTHSVPPYLIAISVGDLQFRSLGRRTGVYSEPSVVDKAARELSDTEKMVQATERIYGPYRWGRYDLLVLPPSFPFGGMENPMLTFATPTILAGDKSLVSLVAHELAHSWSGNLVTNATWSDFWLNEGFTTYLERRIIESVYGEPRREMEAMLGRASLEKTLAATPTPDQILHVDLKGRDPDDGVSSIPYEKGALFLRWMEEKIGRERFDRFVRSYFDSHAFQSITTKTFLDYLDKENLLDKREYRNMNPPRDRNRLTRRNVEAWIYGSGLPENAPRPMSDAFQRVAAQAKNWLDGKITAQGIQTSGWTTQEWLHFLSGLPENLGAQKMKELDQALNLTKTGNSEISFQWLFMSIRNKYVPAYPRLEEFLTTIGRRKFVKPLYDELVKTPEGTRFAVRVYAVARPGYHPITQATIDEVLKGKS